MIVKLDMNQDMEQGLRTGNGSKMKSRQNGNNSTRLLCVIILLVSCNIAITLLLAGGLKTKNQEVSNKKEEDVLQESVTGTENETIMDADESASENFSDDLADMEADMLKNVIKESMESGESVMSLLRRLYPEYVVVFKKSAYQFIPIDKSLAPNKLKQENIKVLEDHELQYEIDGKIVSKKGIDVSKYQGNIDWKKVAADGVEFAMIRLGYRGYGTGALVLDGLFEQNIQGAKAAGIKVGVYFFSQAISVEEAEEEAEFVLQHLEGYQPEYPVVFDTEEIANDSSRMEGMTPTQITDTAIAFCETIKAAGYQPMVYANLRWFNQSLEMSRLEAYEKWYAYYDKEIYFPYKVDIWQYSDSGQVDGIEGAVDMNIAVSYDEQ